MKLYLLLLNILFASTSFAFEYYHEYNGKYIVTPDCNTIYVCIGIEEKIINPCGNLAGLLGCPSSIEKVYSECVDQSGDAVSFTYNLYDICM